MNRARLILPERRSRHAARREFLVALVLVLVAGGGAGLSLALPTDVDDAPSEGAGSFGERAAFCPALPDGAEGVSDVAAGSRRGAAMDVLVEPLDSQAEAVAEDRIVLRRVDAAYPHNVVGLGDLLGATIYTEFDAPLEGVAAASCSVRASKEWFFPQGSSSDGYNERLVVYNPFPGDAVVRVVLFTPSGPRTRAALNDIPVPSGRATTIAVNRFVLQQPVLAAQVTAVRGRVAAWKYLFVRSPAPARGASFTIGAPETASTWYFPAARVDRNMRATISLFNPTDEEAVVTVSLVTEGEPLQPADLDEMSLPRQSSRTISLRRALQGEEPGEVSIVVTSLNEVPIAAERSLIYNGRHGRGFSTHIGAPAAATGWWVGPTTAEPEQEWLTVLNVSDEETEVRMRLARPAGPARWTRAVTLGPGGRATVPLPRAAGSGAVLVEADAPIVAERLGRGANDISLLMGLRTP